MRRCLGALALSPEEVGQVLQSREDFKKEEIMKGFEAAAGRTLSIQNAAFPLYSSDLPRFRPDWDVEKQDRAKVRQMRLRKLVAAVNKSIIRQRAAKKLNLLAMYLANLKRIQSETPLLISSIPQSAELAGEKQQADKKASSNTYANIGGNAGLFRKGFENFVVELNEMSLAHRPVALQTFKQLEDAVLFFEDSPMSWSEDLAFLEPLLPSMLELHDYGEMNPNPNASLFPLACKLPQEKKGAPDETAFCE